MYLTLFVQMQSAAYVSVKKDSYRRALECNSVCRYSYLALLEFKLGGWLLRQASTLNRRTSSFRLPPPLPSSITTKGEDVRLRDARQPRSLFIEYLYTIQLSFKGRRGGRKGGRTLEGSRVTQTGIGCQSQTMGGPNRYVPVPGEYRRRSRQEVEVTIGHALENFDFFFFRNPFRLYREILFWRLLIIYI